jgi:hypothetical protein
MPSAVANANASIDRPRRRPAQGVYPSSHPASRHPLSSFLPSPDRPFSVLISSLDLRAPHTRQLLDLGRRLSKQSALAKLVMNGHLGQNPLPPPPPPPHSFPLPASLEHERHLPAAVSLAARDALITSHPQQQTGPSPVPPAMRAMHNMSDLTDTPPNARSVNSTAPSSPRM